jgi:mannosyl-3-phosphoglycerate phosphatase
MGINDPFISENGSAIFIPRGYFQFDYSFTRQTRRYSVIELGTAYSIIREKLDKVKERSAAEIIGFGDMTEKEIAKDSGLPLKLAKLAKRRQYTEPFRIIKGNERRVLKAIKEENLRFTKGGRYIHLMGNSDKEKAVAILKGLYSQKFDKLKTFGLGDSPNDLSMLKVVDVPIFVKETSRQHKRDAVWKGVLNEIRAHSSEK